MSGVRLLDAVEGGVEENKYLNFVGDDLDGAIDLEKKLEEGEKRIEKVEGRRQEGQVERCKGGFTLWFFLVWLSLCVSGLLMMVCLMICTEIIIIPAVECGKGTVQS